MHSTIKHIVNNIGISLFLLLSVLISSSAHSEQTAEDIIKARKALFSSNYRTAKRVQSLSSSKNFNEAKKYHYALIETYQSYGMNCLEVPKSNITNRIEFILYNL